MYYTFLYIQHCVSAGFGLHSPGSVSAPVSVQVLVLDPESTSPSSHWKVATLPTVVSDTLRFPAEGNSGTPQSTTTKQMIKGSRARARARVRLGLGLGLGLGVWARGLGIRAMARG